ncbi:MAG: lipoate--protein ligase family protein [Chloroflexi bacterium]|nr:lipoate--protein ligase family protein [Chloroflexota bacterium]
MDWRLITDDGVSAAFGLSADETTAERVGRGESPPTLRLYTYRSYCALVGRFQNVENELRVDFCRENRIPINRRPTGGGAIIMGEDQLGIALTLPAHVEDTYSRAREIMSMFSEGIVRGLSHFGIQAHFHRKNDIVVNGKKIVGLGIHRAQSDGLLFHASVLVDLDVPFMLKVLNTPFEKISDKEIATITERITTVRREAHSHIPLDEVRRAIAAEYEASHDATLVPGEFTVPELEDISRLETEKYLTDDWIYQTSSIEDSAGGCKIKTPEGLIDVHVTMAGPTIKAAYIGGDFFASAAAVADLEGALRWRSGQPEKVAGALEEVYLRRREEFNNLPLEYIVQAVQKSVARAQATEVQEIPGDA